MSSYYLDTSALVKYYAREPGTPWVKAIVDPAAGHNLFTVSITGAELVAGIVKKGRTGELAPPDVQRTVAAIRADWPAYALIVGVQPQLVEHAMDLIVRHGVRGYDAIHLAAALAVQQIARQVAAASPISVSADESQCRAAAAEGLVVENPNLRP